MATEGFVHQGDSYARFHDQTLHDLEAESRTQQGLKLPESFLPGVTGSLPACALLSGAQARWMEAGDPHADTAGAKYSEVSLKRSE